MKDKIIMLIIGIILGVILAGGCFWFATSITQNDKGNMPDMEKDMTRQERDFGPNSNAMNNQTTTENNS